MCKQCGRHEAIGDVGFLHRDHPIRELCIWCAMRKLGIEPIEEEKDL